MNNCGLCTELGKWWRAPLNGNTSALEWIMFVGLIIIAAFLWTRILARII